MSGAMRTRRAVPVPRTSLVLALVSAASFTATALPAQATRQHPPPPAPLAGLDGYIERAMRDWEIPGLAIAVVEGGETVWARGFGVRDLRTKEPVDENTLFAIGSASKAFTAAAVGMMVQEGLLSFDDRATKYLPTFETSDPYVTRELTVRDLLTHRSGLSRGDQVWYATELERDEILHQVRYQPPTTSFRSAFGYNNNMVLAAGQLVPTLTGLSWDDFVDRRIFAPLGMERSVTSTLPLARMENVAQPHAKIDGKVTPIPWRNIDNIAPAGSINSSVSEMALWVCFQLARGEWNGQQLLDPGVVREMHSAQTIIPLEGQWALMAPDAHFMMYGMGWFLHDYRARKIVEHGGNIDGMHALVAMMPEEDAGLVILTNLPNYLTYALMHRVFDAYIGGAETDWSKRYQALLQAGETQQRAMEDARVSGTSPSLAIERYAGRYRHPMYGEVAVTLEDGRLVARRGPSFVGDLKHWHYDTFRIDWRGDTRGDAFITFHLDARGEPARANMQGLGNLERVRAGAEGAS